MITPSSTSESVTQIGNMVSRVCFVDGFQGDVVARFARDYLKATRVGILHDQSQAYSTGLAHRFEAAFRALSGAAYLSPQLRDIYVFTILIFVPLIKPSGLFGRTAVEKV